MYSCRPYRLYYQLGGNLWLRLLSLLGERKSQVPPLLKGLVPQMKVLATLEGWVVQLPQHVH